MDTIKVAALELFDRRFSSCVIISAVLAASVGCAASSFGLINLTDPLLSSGSSSLWHDVSTFDWATYHEEPTLFETAPSTVTEPQFGDTTSMNKPVPAPVEAARPGVDSNGLEFPNPGNISAVGIKLDVSAVAPGSDRH